MVVHAFPFVFFSRGRVVRLSPPQAAVGWSEQELEPYNGLPARKEHRPIRLFLKKTPDWQGDHFFLPGASAHQLQARDVWAGGEFQIVHGSWSVVSYRNSPR